MTNLSFPSFLVFFFESQIDRIRGERERKSGFNLSETRVQAPIKLKIELKENGNGNVARVRVSYNTRYLNEILYCD